MNDLQKNIDKLHTTELGKMRIIKNLSLKNVDAINWCKQKILSSTATITRQGKNWYVIVDNVKITINAHSYTIITAHKLKKYES